MGSPYTGILTLPWRLAFHMPLAEARVVLFEKGNLLLAQRPALPRERTSPAPLPPGQARASGQYSVVGCLMISVFGYQVRSSYALLSKLTLSCSYQGRAFRKQEGVDQPILALLVPAAFGLVVVVDRLSVQPGCRDSRDDGLSFARRSAAYERLSCIQSNVERCVPIEKR
jgi:hypothetical protein